MFVELDAIDSKRSLEEETQRKLGELRFQQTHDGLVAECENLAAFLLPLVILQEVCF